MRVSTTPSSPRSSRLLTEVTLRDGKGWYQSNHTATSLFTQNQRWSTLIKIAKVFDLTKPVFLIQQPSQFVCQTLPMTPWMMSLRNPTTHAHILFSWPSTRSMANSSPIKPANSPSHPTAAMHMLLSSTSSTPMQFAPFPSRIAQKKSFSMHVSRSKPGSLFAASNLSCINLTTNIQRHWNICRNQINCIQYTPPDIHRTNPAERPIRTWKKHVWPQF